MKRIMLNQTTTPAIQRISTIQIKDTIMAMTKALKYKNTIHEDLVIEMNLNRVNSNMYAIT